MNSLVNREQIKASNPYDSVWVSASAGTGKTKVLTDRVLRLLLQSNSPEKILCITFTKAAAAEMSNRINGILQQWAICDNKQLAQHILALSGEEPDEETIKRARQLFVGTLEAPGGMKIMTIHSFCQTLLQRFPLEADVPPHFDVLDDLTSRSILEQILNDIFSDNSLHDILSKMLSLISSNSLPDIFNKILDNSADFSQLIARHPGGIQSIIFAIKQYFNLIDYHSENEIINEHFNTKDWPIIKSTYLTQKDEIFKARGNKKNLDPEIAQQVFETNEKIKKFRVTEATTILLTLAFHALIKYQTIKDQKSALDYTDLIEKANELLTKSSTAAWVLYKLDGGIDHILVDEAQDTNKAQWSIIQALTEEFFSGDDQNDQLRTLFVVGDKKQSIFSFQGADPSEFEKMRQYFETKIRDSQNNFQNIPLNYSFRSTEPILRLVNYLLKNEQSKDGVLWEGEEAFHLANRSHDAGLVEIWPLEEDKTPPPLDPWAPPIARQDNTSAMHRLINKMGDKIESLIGKEILPSKNRLIQPNDILILLQQRGKMMGEIVKMLNKRHIPVAGIDRLVLTDHLAIQDLMALTEFVLQPENDLNLANLIKSPLLNLKEDDLYAVCVHRDKSSVWQRLKKLYPTQAAFLKQVSNIADKAPPFEFYSTVLSQLKGRQNFVKRFGLEVNEALDEFLNLALKFEQDHTPSLQSFLNWFSQHKIEIKRDLDNSTTNAVRIMTVHASKGLQGNIVFLPDTRLIKARPEQGGQIVWTENDLPLWLPSSGIRPHSLDVLFKKRERLSAQERRRLLYVAVTRACDYLYIGGYGKAYDNNWYDLVKNAVDIPKDKDGIIRFNSEQTESKKNLSLSPIVYDFDNIPQWALTDPKEEPPVISPISPSKLGEKEGSDIDYSVIDKDQTLALRRGTFLHKLLQFLPDIPKENRLKIAQKLCPADIDLPSNLMDLFEKEELKELFGPNSLAEVPIVGTFNGQPISGQIDRLVILKNEIKIIDYKTNRYVPSKAPEIYRKQLLAYKDLLKKIFPDRMVRTYLLWTQTLYYEEIK